MAKKTVVVGMSGGVDSSVAALLLKEQGYDVVGLFMVNWEENDKNGACTAEEDYADVRRVSALLDIPYYTVNFSKEYMDRVFSYFLAEYSAGRTPNPDVLCNREIKFASFKEYAFSLGADCIATGHYCGVRHEGARHLLCKAADTEKDQTYFLNQLTQDQLSDVLFPLQNLKKAEVREIAFRAGLPTARKKDSTGICFIGERNFRQFLRAYLPATPGKIVDTNGKVVGEHIGLMYYTLGQRRGLGLGGAAGEDGRWFVLRKDLQDNILYVSHGDESPLYSRACDTDSFNWIPGCPAEKHFPCTAKFRHRQEEQPVTVTVADPSHTHIEFAERQRAVTEGQFAVLYKGDLCLGGGAVTDVYY